MALDMDKPLDEMTREELLELKRIKSYGQQPSAPAAPVQAQPPSVPSPEIQQTKQQAPIPAAEPPQSPGMMSRAYDALAPIIPFSGRGLSFAGDGVTSRIVRGGHQAMKAVDKFLSPDGGETPPTMKGTSGSAVMDAITPSAYTMRAPANAARGVARMVKGVPEFFLADLPARGAAALTEQRTTEGGGSASVDPLSMAWNAARGAAYDAPHAAAEMISEPLARFGADYTPNPGQGFTENAAEKFAANPTGIIEQVYFPGKMIQHGLTKKARAADVESGRASSVGQTIAGPAVRVPIEVAKAGVTGPAAALGLAKEGISNVANYDVGGPKFFEPAARMVGDAVASEFPTFTQGARGMVDAFRRRQQGQPVTPVPTTDPYLEDLERVPFGDVREPSYRGSPGARADKLSAYDPAESGRYRSPQGYEPPVESYPEDAGFERGAQSQLPQQRALPPAPQYPQLPPAPIIVPPEGFEPRGARAMGRIQESFGRDARTAVEQRQDAARRLPRKEGPAQASPEEIADAERRGNFRRMNRGYTGTEGYERNVRGQIEPDAFEEGAQSVPPEGYFERRAAKQAKRALPVQQRAPQPPTPVEPPAPPQEPLMSGNTQPGDWSAPERPAESQVNSGGKRTIKKSAAAFDPEAFWSNAEKYGSPAEKARVARLRRAVEADTADAYSAATAGMSAADLSAVQSLRNSMERSKPKGTPPAGMKETDPLHPDYEKNFGERNARSRALVEEGVQRARQEQQGPFPEAPAQTGAQKPDPEKTLHMWGQRAFKAFVRTGQVPKKFARLKGTPAFDQGWSSAESTAGRPK